MNLVSETYRQDQTTGKRIEYHYILTNISNQVHVSSFVLFFEILDNRFLVALHATLLCCDLYYVSFSFVFHDMIK